MTICTTRGRKTDISLYFLRVSEGRMVRLRSDSTTAIARELARFCHLLTAAASLMYDQKYDPNVWSAAPPPIEITGGGGLCGTRSLHSSQATQCNSAVHILLYNRYNSCYESGWLRIGRCHSGRNCRCGVRSLTTRRSSK